VSESKRTASQVAEDLRASATTCKGHYANEQVHAMGCRLCRIELAVAYLADAVARLPDAQREVEGL